MYEFTETWSNQKYTRNNNSPFKEWKAMRPAEVQKRSTFHAIGYFIGTTERGHYDTVKNEISKEIGVPMELSFQFVEQQGVTNCIGI